MITTLYTEYKKDRRDIDTPYKALTGQGLPHRFADEESARLFYRNHRGRCLLTVYQDGRNKVLAYKFK